MPAYWIIASITGVLIGVFLFLFYELKKRQKHLLYQSRHDPVTGLSNLLYFQEQLRQRFKEQDQALEKNQENTIAPFAVVTIGIDRFPQINHTLGHQIGDRLLHHVAEQCKQYLPEVQLLSRMASNVFIGILPDVTLQSFQAEAKKIFSLFEKPFSVYTVNIDLDILIGASFFPQDGTNADTLIQKADSALYGAHTRVDRVATYSIEKDPQHYNKLSLMSELREGLSQNEFEVYYQPKINLAKGSIVAVESLIRWQHPLKGFLTPDKFIPMAEETGHIKKLSLWLIEQSVKQCKAWHDQGIEIEVAINLSVKDLLNKELPQYIQGLIAKYNVKAHHLIFEITESAFMLDPESAIAAIKKLKTFDVQISIDDFGTGYSSLRYLKSMPIDELKIDQSFTRDVIHDRKSAEIVRSTIELGHRIGLRIVAEGLSDQETHELLQTFSCDLGQGYLFSKPQSMSDLSDWLKHSPWGWKIPPG